MIIQGGIISNRHLKKGQVYQSFSRYGGLHQAE